MACSEFLEEIQRNLFVTMTVCGIIGYALVFPTLIRNNQAVFGAPFYKICMSLAVNDFAGLFYEYFYYVFMPMYGKNIWWPRLIGFMGRVCWFGAIYHNLLIAFERFLVLVFPSVETKIWSYKRCIGALAAVWSATLLSNVCVLTDACAYVWYPETKVQFYDMTLPGSRLHNKIVDLGIQVAAIVLTVILYFVAGLKVRKIGETIQVTRQGGDNGNRPRRVEKWLFVQGVIISSPLAINIILYHILVYCSLSGGAAKAINFVAYFFGNLLYSWNPFIYLFFNARLREECLRFYGLKKTFMEGSSIFLNPTAQAPSRRAHNTLSAIG